MQESADDNKHIQIRYNLIFAILLIIYTLALAFISYPYIAKNVENANLGMHFSLYMEQKKKSDFVSRDVFLYSINGTSKTNRSVNSRGSDSLHTALEALLLPLSDEELERGLVSYIPRKTKLIGVTNISGYVFAEFSNDLMFSTNLDRAIMQIESTIKEIVDTQGIILISDGVEIN